MNPQDLNIKIAGKFSCFPIPIPFVPVGCAVVSGILSLCDDVNDSRLDAVVTGCVVGTLHLDRNNADGKLYDPTGQLYRIDIRIDFKEKKVYARGCVRKIFEGWDCSDWVEVIAW